MTMTMDDIEFRRRMADGEPIPMGTEIRDYMEPVSREALRITAEMNTGYHDNEEILSMLSELTGERIDPSVHVFALSLR